MVNCQWVWVCLFQGRITWQESTDGKVSVGVSAEFPGNYTAEAKMGDNVIRVSVCSKHCKGIVGLMKKKTNDNCAKHEIPVSNYVT